MGKSSLRVFLLIAAITVLYHGLAKADDVATSANTGLPRLEVAKEYKLPPSPTATGLAAVFVGDAPTAVAWSPDGKELAAFSSYGQNLTVWNVDGGVLKVFHPYMNYLRNSLDFLNDDELLTPPDATHRDDPKERWAFNIWNVRSGNIEKKIPGPEPEKIWEANSSENYAISPDGSMVVSLAQESGRPELGPKHIFKENPVPVYSTKTWDIIQRIPIVHPVSAAFSPDGKQVAFGQVYGKILIYDAGTWKLLKTITACDAPIAPILTLAYSPDNNFIVAGVEKPIVPGAKSKPCPVQLLRVADGTLIGTYPEDMAGDPWKVLWHTSGKFIVFASHDKTLRLWNPAKPDDPGVTIPKVNSMCLAFSPDGKRLASCNDGRITVFNISF